MHTAPPCEACADPAWEGADLRDGVLRVGDRRGLRGERRLRGRGLASEEVILRRLATARAEMQEAPHYAALIVNDDLDTAYDHQRAAYLAATLAPHCRPGLVEALIYVHLL